MAIDRHGLEQQGNAESMEAYDEALLHLVRFKFDVIGSQELASEADPSSAMAGVFGAYLGLMSSEASSVVDARASLEALEIDEDRLSAREVAHLAAARAWVAGDLLGASSILEQLAIDYPRDLLALSVGHQLDFFTGDARRLRDRIGRALGAWSETDEAYGYLEGMYAFGLEESNRYDLSEGMAMSAVDRNGDDVWGIHALAHTYEMQSRISEGLTFLRRSESSWSSHNLLRVHNFWHYALYHLHGGDIDGALRIYDGAIRGETASGVAFELIDATALLWRLFLEGADVGDRWSPLATAWKDRLAPGYYPFNDVHAAMAFAAAGDDAAARALIDEMVAFVDRGDDGTTGWQMTKQVGLPVCKAALAYVQGDDKSVIGELLPIRGVLHTFGGSHAQRDVIERTLLASAMRQPNSTLAHALIAERIGQDPTSGFAWSKLAALATTEGATTTAERAKAQADALTAAIRAA